MKLVRDKKKKIGIWEYKNLGDKQEENAKKKNQNSKADETRERRNCQLLLATE